MVFRASTDFCDSDEDSEDEDKDGNVKEAPDSSKISTTTEEDSKDHDASLSKSLFGESDPVQRRTEKIRDPRQSPVTLISSTTRSGEELKSRIRPNRRLHAIDCANRWRRALKSKPFAQFRIPAGFCRPAVFQSLGWCPSVSLAPGSVQYGRRVLKHGPVTGSGFLRRVSSMDTSSMTSPSQGLTGAPLPFHLQQHVLASQVSLFMMISISGKPV